MLIARRLFECPKAPARLAVSPRMASRIVSVAVAWAALMAIGAGCGGRPDVAPVEPLIGTVTFEREIVLGDGQPVELDLPPYAETPNAASVFVNRYHVVFPAGAAPAGTRFTVRRVLDVMKTLSDMHALPSQDGALQIAPPGIVFATPALLTIFFPNSTANGFLALSAREDAAAWTIIGEGPWNVPSGGTLPNPTGGPPVPALTPTIATVSVGGSGLWTAASYGSADGGADAGADGGKSSNADGDADGG
jgi:hypothetical protein